MRRLPFHKYSPCGNITILLEARLTADARTAVCAEVITPQHLGAEQAGVVDMDATPPRLDMGGGEFCVNATRSFAALLAERGRLQQVEPDVWQGEVASSGQTAPLAVRVRRVREAGYEAAVCLALPALPRLEAVAPGAILVRLPGIAHLILDAARYPLPSRDMSALDREAADWRARLGLQHEAAAGLIRLTPEAAQGYSIMPHVWVRATDSACLETSCGSGSLAAALSLAAGREGAFAIRQPGGEVLHIRLRREDAGWTAWIEGAVRLLARGEAFMESLS